MIVYDGTKKNFLTSVEQGTIADEVAARVLSKMGRHTGSIITPKNWPKPWFISEHSQWFASV